MPEAVATSRRDIETALVEKCWKDPEFKKAVVTDPKGMLERHTGKKLPPHVKIIIHEEDANTLHLSIPPGPANAEKLSDEDLERVAGGTEIVGIVVASVAGGALLTAAVGTMDSGAW
jgi:hypothetical protein